MNAPLPLRWLGVGVLLASLSACDLAPSYAPADLVVPDNWDGPDHNAAARAVSARIRPDWWTLYNDPVLNRLEAEAIANNPDLQAAGERFLQARDQMMRAQSRLMPQIALGFGAVSSMISWEPDIWSAIRNDRKAQLAAAQQRAAEYAAARLSLQAEIAHDYFALRGLDAQDQNYLAAIDYYGHSLDIVQARVEGQISPRLDLVRAQNLLYRTQAEEIDIRAQRQVMEHALAILVNATPTTFHIQAIDDGLQTRLPDVPLSLPSDLLHRRPDIARAERRMAEANRAIGVKKAAYYPNVFIRAGGRDSGAGVELPLFQGGKRRAEVEQAWSEYRETQDEYRSTVLNAFREVEDGLTRVKRLDEELERQQAAVQAAGQAQNMTTALYKGGLDNSLEMIVAQVNTLEANTREVQIQMQLLQASTELIRSLGGGWQSSQLPTEEQIQPFGTDEYPDPQHPDTRGADVTATPPADSRNLTRLAL